jgi:hypothetical protein
MREQCRLAAWCAGPSGPGPPGVLALAGTGVRNATQRNCIDYALRCMRSAYCGSTHFALRTLPILLHHPNR